MAKQVEAIQLTLNPAGRDEGRFPSLANRLAGVRQSLKNPRDKSKEQVTAWQGEERHLSQLVRDEEKKLAAVQAELATVNKKLQSLTAAKLLP